jgi:energy-coupling factor transport system ATP-binding protein
VTAVRLDRVWFAYGAAAVLRDVSLALREGEGAALLGRNGAGKTTLTRLVVALLHPCCGAVWVGARNTARLAPEDLAYWVGYVFQDPDRQLFARTVEEEAAFAPRQLGRSGVEARRAAREALARVGLADLAAAHPYDLSFPQRKLLALAAALAQAPRVLVLDEPTQGLDREGVERVSTTLRTVAASGVGVLAVTHDLAFAVETLERAVVLEEGRVVYDGPCAALATDAARLTEWGLDAPAAARLSVALGLPGTPVHAEAVAAALRERCRGLGGSVSSRVAHDQP